MRLKTFEPLGGGVHQLNSTQNKPSMNLQLFADTSTSTDNSTTILTSTTNPMEGWIKGDIHCFVTNENNFLLVRLLSLLNNSMKVWDITYNTDGGVNTFKCLDGNGTCTYDSNNLLTDIKILDGNSSILDKVQLEYDPVTKFISTYKKIKYNCDGKTIISSLDPDYTSKSALDANTQVLLNSGCYSFSNMNSMFYDCYKLTTLDVSNWDTSNVTDMIHMFSECPSLTTLDVSKWDTSNVISMLGMFNGCISLTTLDVSKWNTSNVTDMSYMFGNCYALTTLDISNWDTSKVTNMHSMFYGCNALTTVTGVIDMKSCTTFYDDMFMNCSKLKGVKIKNPPSGFTGYYASNISSGKIVIVQ